MSTDLAFDLLDLHVAKRKGQALDPERAALLQWRLLREGLSERKRAQRRAALRRARVNVNNTKINLWRRRREWLRGVDDVLPARLASVTGCPWRPADPIFGEG